MVSTAWGRFFTQNPQEFRKKCKTDADESMLKPNIILLL